MVLNPELVKLARHTVGRQKQAFQPPEQQDPSQQGGPPGGDPSQGGAPPGMPPGMPPPGMDPSQGGMPPGGMPPGGAPPMDPSMMGGAGGPVPGGGGMTADTIRQVMQETLGQMGMTPGQPGPGGTAAGGKPGKPDLAAMANDIFQIKKMMSTLFNTMGVPLPQDILDGPNRDPATGAPMAPGTPGSTSDPSRQSPPMSGGAGGAGGQQSAIKPIGQMQGAFPAGGGGGDAGGGGGGGGKTAAARIRIGEETVPQQPIGQEVRNKAAALAYKLKQSRSR